MRLLAVIGFIGIVAAIAVAGYTFGGFYSVAATSADWDPVAWALIRVRDASIDRHASGLASPVALDDPEVVKAGARAFAARGCATCHGAPGVGWAKFSEAMNPDPPDLKEAAQTDTPARIFWIVKNGIKMTAMPAFSGIGADDREIWSITAFVKKLPSVTDADYKAWTAAGG
jgi:mono/diheme cytochrome c family protein